MLIAAIKRKLKSNLELNEDAITSTIFGPLAGMSAEFTWDFVRTMLIAAGADEGLLSCLRNPSDFEVDFWPKIACTASHKNTRFVEPDAIFKFRFPDGSIYNVIVEVKWQSPLNPPCELINQWLSRQDKDQNWLHLYVISSLGKGREDCRRSIQIFQEGCKARGYSCCERQMEKNGPGEVSSWKRSLCSIDWTTIHDLTLKVWSSSSVLNCQLWAHGVARFLERFGYLPFIGYSWLGDKAFFDLQDETVSAFFKELHWFSFLSESRFDLLDAQSPMIAFFKNGGM